MQKLQRSAQIVGQRLVWADTNEAPYTVRSHNLATPVQPQSFVAFFSAFTPSSDAVGISIFEVLGQIMAQKSTIYKVELSVSDMDRHYYETHKLTVAKHPSETDERLMVRIVAFALNAHEHLEMTKGLSTDDEPDIWQKSLSGELDVWVPLGLGLDPYALFCSIAVAPLQNLQTQKAPPVALMYCYI